MPLVLGPMYAVMADAAGLKPEDDLLEVACGSGVFLTQQAGHVRHVAGVDLSRIQVDLARRRLAARIAADTAEIVLGDAAALPWREDSFSAVVCMEAFMAFPDPDRVLAEMFRVLRPGGRALLHIGDAVPPGTTTHRDPGGMWVWSEPDVTDMVQRAGFSEVTIWYANASGDSRLARWVNRVAGSERARLVRAVKA
jgi:cyclopropane fatty-acyl-phospholipid synthase-like methyltransferase